MFHVVRVGFSLFSHPIAKVGCVFPMVVVSLLPHAEFGPNDHLEDATHFICSQGVFYTKNGATVFKKCMIQLLNTTSLYNRKYKLTNALLITMSGRSSAHSICFVRWNVLQPNFELGNFFLQFQTLRILSRGNFFCSKLTYFLENNL